MRHSKNLSRIIQYLLLVRINLALMVVIEVTLGLRQPNFIPRKLILEDTDMMECSSHLSNIEQH